MSLLTPLSCLKVTHHLIPSHSGFPNTSIHNKPLLIYHQTFKPSQLSKSSVTDHIESIGIIEPQWVYPMYREHHYHSTTHEVLIILSGSARLCFGGSDNPEKVEEVVRKGDVVVVPAGVAHAMLEDLVNADIGESTGGRDGNGGNGGNGGKRREEGRERVREKFMMLGCYPVGAEQWDHCTGFIPGAAERIRRLAWFTKDPIYGDDGPAINA